MADKVQRPKPQGGDYRPHYAKREADAYMDRIETELDNYRLTFRAIERQSRIIVALHVSICDLIDKTQSCTSGLSHSECLEEIKGRLGE